MAERVDLPRDSRPTALAEVPTEKLKAESVLVDDGAVVGRRLVVHTPATEYELQPTCKLRFTSTTSTVQCAEQVITC